MFTFAILILLIIVLGHHLFQFDPLVFMLGRFCAWFAPVNSFTIFNIWRTFFVLASEHSLAFVDEACVTFGTEHVALCDQVCPIWRWPVLFRNLKSLELVRMLCISFVTLFAESVIRAYLTVKSVLQGFDSRVTLITSIPRLITLLFLVIINLLFHRLNCLIIKLSLLFLFQIFDEVFFIDIFV